MATRAEAAGPLRDVQAVAFDLDGTLYFGERPADGAFELLACLRDAGVEYFFFTNNSMKTRAAVAEKLQRIGFGAPLERVYTSSHATAVYASRQGWGRVWCLGVEGLRRELEAAGVVCTSGPEDVDALVVGLDSEFDYEMPPEGLDALPADRPIVAANLDITYPVEGGELRPGCGAIVRAVEGWTQRRADHVVGKPGTFMLELLAEEWGLDSRRILVVGDTYYSDIAMARAAGAPSMLIASEPPADAPGTPTVPDLRALLAECAGG